jgi:hypothetical protein
VSSWVGTGTGNWNRVGMRKKTKKMNEIKEIEE